MISFNVDMTGIDDLRHISVATSEQYHKAIRGAVRDTAKSAEGTIFKQVSAKTKVSQKRLKVRLKRSKSGYQSFRLKKSQSGYQSDGSVALWFGTNPIPVHTLGGISKSTRSAAAGGIVRRGAFKAHTAAYKEPRIYIRSASKHFRRDHYSFREITGTFTGEEYNEDGTRESRGNFRSDFGGYSGRFPLHLAVVHINDEAEAALRSLDTGLQQLFEKHFNRRLKHEVSGNRGR